jgi:hypothetical protein
MYGILVFKGKEPLRFGIMMFTACLPQHSQNPTRTNRSSGLIRNSYLLNKQMIIDNSCLGLANTQDERCETFFGQ